MVDALTPLLADGVVDEILVRLKSGKEADLYLVRHGAEVVAAKVYKDRETRSFHNNALYKEGRQVRDTRTQRAMARGSRFGQAAAEGEWKAKESEVLHKLHAAGVRVPAPVLFYEGVLLMEVVLDTDGRPAPRLVDADVPRDRAAEWYADLRGQMTRMLSCDLIHGDLSPYNVLVAWNGPTVIDFPQTVGAAHNSQARAFFMRDFENIHRYFAAVDPALGAREGDGREIWRAYERRELSPEFIPTGRAPPEPGGRERRPGGGDARPRRGRGDRGGPRNEPKASAPQSAAAAPPRQEPARGSPPPMASGPRHDRARGATPSVASAPRRDSTRGAQQTTPAARQREPARSPPTPRQPPQDGRPSQPRPQPGSRPSGPSPAQAARAPSTPAQTTPAQATTPGTAPPSARRRRRRRRRPPTPA